jgi:hypothetical protein
VNQDVNFTFSDEDNGDTTSAEAPGADGTWYCWVQAKSPTNVESEVKSASAVIDTLGPDCVVRLVKPAAGYYTGALSVASIGFSWAVDDDSEVENYIVRVGNNEDLDSASVMESFVVTSGTSYAANLNAGTHGAYSGWWQVGAEDADGNVTWSPVRRIRVGRTANDVNADGYAEILVGAPFWNTNYGHVQLLTCLGRLAPQQVTIYSEGSASSYLGQCINFIGDFDGDGKGDFALGDPYQGRILLYLSSKSNYPPSTFISKENAGIYFGSSIAGGDFNGDGYDDMAVGARTAGNNSRGRVFLYLGNAGGTLTAEYVSSLADNEWEQLGTSLDMADIDNDGYADIIAGAPGNNGSSPYGSVYIYYGGPAATPDLTCDLKLIAPGQAFTYFGYEVAADDIDGTLREIVVGAPGDDSSGTNNGAVYIYRGGAAGNVDSSPSVTIADPFTGWTAVREGYSVDCGDVTGDGLADVLVGVPWYGGTLYQGDVFLYYGNTTINWNAADVYIWTDHERLCGQCVSVAGDLNVMKERQSSTHTERSCHQQQRKIGVTGAALRLATDMTYLLTELR